MRRHGKTKYHKYANCVRSTDFVNVSTLTEPEQFKWSVQIGKNYINLMPTLFNEDYRCLIYQYWIYI